MNPQEKSSFLRALENLRWTGKTHLTRNEIDRVAQEISMNREYALADKLRSMDPAAVSAILRQILNSTDTFISDPQDLFKIANMKMPFGKYKGRTLIDLPEPYVIWFYNQGLPGGELGRLLAQVYEVKINGLEYLFEKLKIKE